MYSDCKHCRGKGLIKTPLETPQRVELFGAVIEITENAVECEACQERERKDERLKFYQRQVESIPELYAGFRFDQLIQDENTPAVEKVKAWTKNPNCSLYFYGPTDGGKTHVAVSAFKVVVWENGMTGMFITSAEIAQLKVSGRLTREFWEKLVNCDLLIIDDLSAEENEYKAGIQAVLNLIYARYMHAKLTIYTANLGPKRLQELDTEGRAASRVIGSSISLEFVQTGHRINKTTPRTERPN